MKFLMAFRQKLLTEIGTLAENKEIEGISDLRDESNKKGMYCY